MVWHGSGFNEYTYDDLDVGDYTNVECQSETKESAGDGTIDCVDSVESFNRVCVDCAVEEETKLIKKELFPLFRHARTDEQYEHTLNVNEHSHKV